MPCRTEDTEDDDCNPTATRDHYYERFKHDSDLAEMFCAVMTTLENGGKLPFVAGNMSPDLTKRVGDWWGDHKRRDAEKAAREEHERVVLAARQKYDEDLKQARVNLSAALERAARK